MEREVWLEGLLLPYHQRRWHMSWGKEDGTPSDRLLLALSACGDGSKRARRVEELLRRCERLGVAVISPADDGYPRDWLDSMDDPPVALFVRGDATLLRAPDAVSIVGARRATPEGISWAERCGADLARAGCPVVSGLAYGIDSASHRGCLRGGGRPVGVLGTGIDEVYPTAHAELHMEVAKRGCLVSEFAPGSGARKHHFVARNRILAGLGRGLVVVEAGSRSGTLSTVGFAQSFGRDILAVPGIPHRPQHASTLQLIRDGASMVRDARDILEDLGLRPLEALEQPLLPGGLPGPARVEEMAAATGRPVGVVLAELSALEISGKVRRLRGGLYSVVPS